MSIILVRHGETLLNAARVLQPAETPLSERGRAQARALGARLASTAIAGVVTSDLPRARQTADAIAAACGCDVVLQPLLQERNFGDLRGRPYDSLGFDPLGMEEAPPQGESSAAFNARVAAALAAIVAARASTAGDLVVVTHGLVIAAMLERQVHLASGIGPPRRYGNTSVTYLSAAPPHTVGLLDCTAHLDSDASIGNNRSGLSGG